METYFEGSEFVDKRKGTQDNERQALNRWNDYLGFVRVANGEFKPEVKTIAPRKKIK